ncbi:MAG: hypothetical protein ACR2FG_06665 [Marmoricola sp.]
MGAGGAGLTAALAAARKGRTTRADREERVLRRLHGTLRGRGLDPRATTPCAQPYSRAPANLIVTQGDYRWLSLGMRTVRGPMTALKVALRRPVAMARKRKMYAMATRSRSACAKGWSRPAYRSCTTPS